ncbi:MAG: hypothetical protein HYY05_06115 [Chloroflexi bacterium]|nr:hypothetical protein [Chloroflexota bacterium]
MALAVAADEPLVGALIAVSLPTGRLDPAGLQRPGLPKLFLTGSADPIAQAGSLHEAAKRLPPPVTCHVATGADHFWWGHEAWLVERIAAFLAPTGPP